MSALPLILAFMLALVGFWLYFENLPYTCPQCGSRNGEHDERCSWRK